MTTNLTIEKELDVMSKFKLDANHWFVLRYLFIAKYEGDNSYLFKYFTECAQTGAPRDVLASLQKKSIISKEYEIPEKGSPLITQNIIFSESFIQKYFKTSFSAGRELFDEYPPFLKMDNGVLLPARNLVSKVVFKSIDDFFFFYCKTIKFDAFLHAQIIQSLRFAKENDLVRSSIVEYCISQKWTEHIEAMNSGSTGGFTNYHNPTEIL